MAADPRLLMEDVACVRGGRLLWEAISLRLNAGEALIVSGPNGAGKSSLLRVAGGLLRPAVGRVRRGTAALADEAAALDERATLRAALGFWARLDGGDVDAGLAAMDLHALADVPVRLLSSGQRRRAGLARAVASGADLWLLDEPGNGLDASALHHLADAVTAHRAHGGAVLAASHQPLGWADTAALALAG